MSLPDFLGEGPAYTPEKKFKSSGSKSGGKQGHGHKRSGPPNGEGKSFKKPYKPYPKGPKKDNPNRGEKPGAPPSGNTPSA